MPPPRRASRPKDPARSKRAQPRASHDPETGRSTIVREEGDPEWNQRTQARAQFPAGSDAPDEASYDTAGQYESPEGSYHTGDYQASYEDLAGVDASSISLEGDGLDALDPEVGSHTSTLPALDRADATAGGDEEGADDANATRAGPPLRLDITAGPDAGKKRKFKGVRMVIGRTAGVDLQLADQSVSRRHVELIYGDEGVLLKDLGSGNGTRVNGTRVAEKKLEHGDEIHIGKTKLTFVDELAAFKQAREDRAKADEAENQAIAAAAKASEVEESATEAGEMADEPDAAEEADKGGRPKRTGTSTAAAAGRRPVRTSRREAGAGGFAEKFKALPKAARLGIVGGAAVLLLLLVLGIALQPPPPPPVDVPKRNADSKMSEARQAVREEDYARAVQLIDEAERMVPGIDKSNVGKQVRQELAFRATLDEVRKAVEERRFEDARKALETIGRASVKSEEAKAAVVIALEKAELEYKKTQVDELLAAGEVEAARRLLGELPVTMQAESAQAIVEFERQLEEQEAQEARDVAAAARRSAANAKAQREEEMNAAFVVVERKFASAEWDRAASECTRVQNAFSDKAIVGRAKKLQGLIPSFGRNYDEGMKKYRNGQLAQAAKPLRVAHGLYGQIGLRANRYGQELEEKLGAAALSAGKESLVRNDLVTAWQMFRDAAKFDPSDAKARKGLDDVAERAQDLFESAYAQRDTDARDAMRKFRIVVQVTDPGSTVHEKAKNQLAAMAP